MVMYRLRMVDESPTDWITVTRDEFAEMWRNIPLNEITWCEVIVDRGFAIQKWKWHFAFGWDCVFHG